MHKNMTMILEGSGDEDEDGSDIEVDAGDFNRDSHEEEEEEGYGVGDGNIARQLLLSLEDVKVSVRDLGKACNENLF